MTKPIAVKPGLYALFYEHLKQIAMVYGYNLVVNGSMNRDLDLIAIPWTDTVRPPDEMIIDFTEYLTGLKPDKVHHGTMPGGRSNYIIHLNRGDKKGEWNRFADEEYYLDISVTPLIAKT